MKLKNIIIILAVMITVITSCKKESKLNPIPTSLISDASAYDTPDRISNLVRGLYASFKGSGFWGSQYIYYSEARSGNFISTNLNPTRGGLSYMMTVDPATSDVSSVWEQGYQIVNACNVFLSNMDNKGGAIVGPALNKTYTAEARFLRGLTYYYLLQLYADPYTKNAGQSKGLPLRLTPNVGLADYDLARSSVDDVYKQIMKDFDFAEANLPDSYSTAILNTTRAHKNTVIAAKVKAYLSMGDYPKVIIEGNKIVSTLAPFKAASGVAFQLQSDIIAVFKSPFASNESILSMPFSSTDVPGTSLGNAYLPDGANANTLGKSGTGDFYLYEKGVVADVTWKTTDSRRSFVFKTPSGSNAGRSWCVKYATGSPFTDYIPVIRYADVLLSLSEALANVNGVDTRALALLNAVRQRSDASTLITATSKQDLIDKIVQERNIEFMGEGIRNADLMRLRLAVPAKLPAGGSPVPQINIGDPNYLWPIPTSETLYNKAI